MIKKREGWRDSQPFFMEVSTMCKLFEERFFATERWQVEQECLNLRNINEPPSDYTGMSKEWLRELTTFIFLYPKEWEKIYAEYLQIIKNRNIESVHTLLFSRDDEGYMRKNGEQDIFLRVMLDGNVNDIRGFESSSDWTQFLTSDGYLDYIKLTKPERKKYINSLRQQLQRKISGYNIENDTNLTAGLDFITDPEESRFEGNDILIDPLNETYFIL